MEHVVEVVSDSTGEAAEDFHLLRLADLGFEAFLFFLQTFTAEVLAIAVVKNARGFAHGFEIAKFLPGVAILAIRDSD
jgi:hypothetical protein